MQGVASLRHLYRVWATVGADALRFGAAWVRSRTTLAAENLFLRKQLALYWEQEVTPRRATDATRLVLVVLARVFPWRDALLLIGHRLPPHSRVVSRSVLGGLHHEYGLKLAA